MSFELSFIETTLLSVQEIFKIGDALKFEAAIDKAFDAGLWDESIPKCIEYIQLIKSKIPIETEYHQIENDEWNCWQCQNCKNEAVWNEYMPDDQSDPYNFCSKCGAKIVKFVRIDYTEDLI